MRKCNVTECWRKHFAFGYCYQHRKLSPLLALRHEASARKGRRTFLGKLRLSYLNIQYRVSGRHRSSAKGKPCLSKQEFYRWALSTSAYLDLYLAWQQSGYAYQFSPSVDRLDNSKGYLPDNMQWLTQTQNSRKH